MFLCCLVDVAPRSPSVVYLFLYKQGLSVSLDVALLYRIDPGMAGQLFQNVGVDYAKVLIEPEAASVIRGLTSGESN